MTFARIVYEFRWWHWWLFTGSWPVRTLYYGPYHLDRESRHLIIERIEREKAEKEPAFRGTYPKRRQKRDATAQR